VSYLNEKIRSGCDAVQIFDTWAGNLAAADFEEFSLRYLRYICERLETSGAPVIVFAKGIDKLSKLADLRCDVLGVDWTKDISEVKAEIAGRKALQGNLDPCVLFAPREKIRQETERILKVFGPEPGHVFNLGHGILPNTSPENAKYLVQCVKEISTGFRRHAAA
jgi:uroporphyrinogen decarboxylase